MNYEGITPDNVRKQQLDIMNDMTYTTAHLLRITMDCMSALAINYTTDIEYNNINDECAWLVLDYDDLINQYELYKLQFDYLPTINSIDSLMIINLVILGELNKLNTAAGNLNEFRTKYVNRFSSEYGPANAMLIEIRSGSPL